MVSTSYIATPGKKIDLANSPTKNRTDFPNKDAAAADTEAHLKKLRDLQEHLYAESKQALLVIFQAMDAGGKDGAIRTVFTGVNPQGCGVTSFKVPSTLERSHDFLWRHHLACPAAGMIGIHNRSHYETVLVERVHSIVPEKVWSARYDQINAFEQMLTASGTTILKFFLHISKDEQKEHLQSRLDKPDKHWKFNIGDLAERKLWDEYQLAYQDAIERCSTSHAPWYIVPSDQKWYRNNVVSRVIAETLEKMAPKFPVVEEDLSKVVIE
ncbi:MAG TPA: polyphosphate kinase 2 family protein [Tepidisphaeraceae bacterium]|jgi:PPK2 family polyphosphate:nucleotide phosphotransferase|nr:polyphosphate kinase 2 family protein [Tepidisphaeraceae bacterium]